MEIEPIAAEILDTDEFRWADYEDIASSRSHFFPKDLYRLEKRGAGTIEDLLRSHFHDDEEMRPARKSLRNVLKQKPITLAAACKLKRSFDLVWEGDAGTFKERLRDVLTVGGVSVKLGARSVVPSIYYIDPAALKDAREELKLKRKQSARLIYEGRNYPESFENLFVLLEKGHTNKHGTMFHFRITRYLAMRIFDVLQKGFATIAKDYDIDQDELDWADFFRSDRTLGPKGGDNTRALLPSEGNLLDFPAPAMPLRAAAG